MITVVVHITRRAYVSYIILCIPTYKKIEHERITFKNYTVEMLMFWSVENIIILCVNK